MNRTRPASIVLFVCLASYACGSGQALQTARQSSTCSPPGGAVSGPKDAHCTAGYMAVDSNSCILAGDDSGLLDPNTPFDPNSLGDPNTLDDPNMLVDGEVPLDAEFGATMYNGEGIDDDCKYLVKWTVEPVCRDEGVMFGLLLLYAANAQPVLEADPYIEATLGDTVALSIDDQVTQEYGRGSYLIGPVKFNARGRWTVRFHINDSCDSGPSSPLGHAAFFVQVP